MSEEKEGQGADVDVNVDQGTQEDAPDEGEQGEDADGGADDGGDE